jgi:hypothetical protein
MLPFEEYDVVLKAHYDALTREKLVNLLNAVVTNQDYKDAKNELIYSIVQTIREYYLETEQYRISFKQWKALNAFAQRNQQSQYKIL